MASLQQLRRRYMVCCACIAGLHFVIECPTVLSCFVFVRIYTSLTIVCSPPNCTLPQVVVGLLVGSSGFWTWQLRCKLAEHARLDNEFTSLRLWLAWALLGVTPLVLFFASGIYHSAIVEPSHFVQRLNSSLARFHLAYSTDRGQLLRVDPSPETSWRKPLRIRTSR